MKTSQFFALLLLVTACLGQDAIKDEPEKLAQLRSAWMNAKEEGTRPIKHKYLNALIKLQDEFTKKERYEDALLVRSEVELIREEQERAEDHDGKSGPARLVSLRDTFNREMGRLSKEKDDIYLDALASLQRKFSSTGNLEAALAVGAEIKRLAIDDTQVRPPPGKWSAKTLIGTIWEEPDGTRYVLERRNSLGTARGGKTINGNTWHFIKEDVLEFRWQGGAEGKVTVNLERDGTSGQFKTRTGHRIRIQLVDQ